MRRDFNSQKNPLSDNCDAAWNMYGIYIAWPGWLSRVQLWLWQSKLRQVWLSQNLCGEWKGNWMGVLLPTWNINRNIMWPLTPKCLSSDETPCVPGSDKMHGPQYFSHLLLFQKLSVYFSFSTEKPAKRLGSTVQLSRGVGLTECITTPPTQSWYCI